MPEKKFTGAILKNIKPLPGQARTNYFDASYKGLCLRVGARDKTWAYYFRFDGRKRYKTLGRFAPGSALHMDRNGAIAVADEITQRLDKGEDPTPTLKAPKPKPAAKNPNTYRRRVDLFLSFYENQVKPATYYQASRLLRSEYVAEWESTDIDRITRPEIVQLLEKMDETPTQANRLQAYLSKFFNWSWDRGYVDPSPMAGLKKRFVEKSRKRHLDALEINKLWKACIELGYPLGDWCRFTLATGQRPGECLKLSRNDLHNHCWLVEGGDPKNDERHRIPLPKLAREIVEAAPEFSGSYVFTTTAGKKPLSQGGKPYNSLYQAAEIDSPWRPHDLRRTFQTIASEELDVEPHLLGAVCNQKSIAKPGISNVYNQAKWMEPKKEALEAWNTWLMGIVK